MLHQDYADDGDPPCGEPDHAALARQIDDQLRPSFDDGAETLSDLGPPAYGARPLAANPAILRPRYSTKLAPQHIRLLEASGVSPEVADERGYYSPSHKAAVVKLGFSQAQADVPALVIPIYDVTGAVATYQLRRDHPRVGKNGRAVKYETPGRSRMVLDVPPRARPHLGNPHVDLLITEGTRKADAAVTAGACSVALLGVWNFRGTNSDGGKTALGDWEAIALNDRKVRIGFDSDAMEKPQVHHALERLRTFLESRGARVEIVYFPAGPDGAKVGLDDYLASGKTIDDVLSLSSSTLRPLPIAKPTSSAISEPQVDTKEILDGLVSALKLYMVLPKVAVLALALWILHTHVIEAAEVTPYIIITSPEKRCGKSRLLDVLELLVANPWKTGRTTAAGLVRKIDSDSPTLLLDEADAAFGGDQQYTEALRGILNDGYRRGGAYSCCVGKGDDLEVRDYRVFSPKAIAAIGKLPDTVMDRSITISLQRKSRGEPVQRFRTRDARKILWPLRDRAASWASQNVGGLKDAQPQLPEELSDRSQDGWEPLLAIADLASPEIAAEARQAAITLSSEAVADDDSKGVRLLKDVYGIFSEKRSDRIPSEKLAELLSRLEESPWGPYRGNPFDARQVARLLRPFKIAPKQIRFGKTTGKGYYLADFVESWERYGVADDRNIGNIRNNVEQSFLSEALSDDESDDGLQPDSD